MHLIHVREKNRVKIAVSWYVTLYSLVGVDLVYHIYRLLLQQCFVSINNLIPLPWWLRHHIPLKQWYTFTREYSVTCWTTATLLFTTMRNFYSTLRVATFEVLTAMLLKILQQPSYSLPWKTFISLWELWDLRFSQQGCWRFKFHETLHSVTSQNTWTNLKIVKWLWRQYQHEIWSCKGRSFVTTHCGFVDR